MIKPHVQLLSPSKSSSSSSKQSFTTTGSTATFATMMMKFKLTSVARVRFTIYVSLFISIILISNWYTYHSISYTLLFVRNQQHHSQQWNPELVLSTTKPSIAITTSVIILPPRNETVPINDVPADSTILDSSSSSSTNMVESEEEEEVDDDPIDIGILSSLDDTFFRNIQMEIDDKVDPQIRCQRYNYTYDTNNKTTTTTPYRRIFYGTLIADETLELLHIIATETYQIYTGIVLVESNRTQSFIHTRPWKHVLLGTTIKSTTINNNNSKNGSSTPPINRRQRMIASLFGMKDMNQVLIKPFINENKRLLSLYREHQQRDLIIQGWKELGMQSEDIGIIADVDETFSRDYLRALQTCSNIPQFQYQKHHCHHASVKIISKSLVYESSPQCRTQKRYWFHPDIIIGHCIDGIANVQQHPSAPRIKARSFVRAPGFGQDCDDWYNESQITNQQYPSWNAADFRRTCSGPQQVHPTGYHFHNFFIDMNTTRYKYYTYGHADTEVYQKPIYQMSDDLQMMYNCVNDLPDAVDSKWKRSVMDLENDVLDPLVEPIYFMDQEYRQRRHEHVQAIVKADDEMLAYVSVPSATPTQSTTTTITLLTATPKQQQQQGLPEQQYVNFFDTYNDRDESIHATVMAMATNYDLWTYQRFVGSLRYSGYKGHIIVALEPNPSPIIIDYLLGKNVTIKILSWVNCTYMMMDDNNNKNDIFQKTTCADPYPDIKIRWSRFPLMRDWLTECKFCTGPVMITDARDLLFQRNPFDIHAPKVTGLQLYQEHINLTTQNWLTEWPIRECKGVSYDEPMLCSGTTIGTRETMLEYLTIMYEEMKEWITDPKCRFNINGDDQSIHNYLYYSGKFPNDTTISVPNRMGGLVNTIGYHASIIARQYLSPSSNHMEENYPGATATTWIGRTEFGLTNDDGLLVELDGTTISRVVHQWDRFGPPYIKWLNQQPWAQY